MIKATETKLRGCFVLEPQVFEDDRGYFFERYNHRDFCKAIDQEVNFVQDNQSFSKKGVLRGLHFQKGEHAQAKLVSVLQGKIQDVVVDLRKDSPTFGQHISMELSDKNRKQLFIPKGFAHGFLTLSKSAQVFYKCDYYYHIEAEAGLYYKDQTLAIDWDVDDSKIITSKKDSMLPFFNHKMTIN